MKKKEGAIILIVVTITELLLASIRLIAGAPQTTETCRGTLGGVSWICTNESSDFCSSTTANGNTTECFGKLYTIPDIPKENEN